MSSDLLATLQDPEVLQALSAAPDTHKMAFAKRAKWLSEAHNHQVLPHGNWWSIWLLLAGRGAGKTRTAAEQIWWWAWEFPGTRWLVSAPTSADVRATCFEGDSGLLAVIPKILIADYNKQMHELKLVNGSLIKGIPASEPERFRGPQFHGGWCCTPGTLIMLANGHEIPIEDVRVGHFLMTRHGVRKVLCSAISGNPNDLVTIGCGDTSLTVTIDHPILVGDQWIPAGDIRPGDLVWATSTSAADTRTESSTSSIRGQSPKVGSFTIRMRTRATTTLTILRRCLAKSISGFTQLAGQTLTPRKQPQAEPLSPCVPQSQPSASSAKPTLSQRLLARLASSALGRALRLGGATGSPQSCAPASSAKASTLPKSDSSGTAASGATVSPQCGPIELKQVEVLRVGRLPNSVTYNLTVEGEHEFIANGIVVHNCDELAAWDYLQEAWDQIMFGMRLKVDAEWKTRLICTTTPRPKDLIVELVGREGDDVHLTTASTYANIDNLSDNFRKQIMQYEGTKLGQQEIYAEILDPEEGGIVKRDWFKLWPATKPLPKLEFILQSYDCAFTEKAQNDPTACISFGVFKPQDGGMCVLVMDAWQDRLQYPDMKDKVLEEYESVYGEGKDARRVDLVLVEEKASGISLIQDLQRAHVFVRAYNPGRADKVQRLSIVSNIIRAGRVWIPESSNRKGYVRDWAEGMVSQICSFPETTHDDFCDAMSQALRYLRDAGWLNIDPPPPEDYDADDVIDAGWEHRKRENPYAA
jgi:predicted phage terminase large subunit-like protein